MSQPDSSSTDPTKPKRVFKPTVPQRRARPIPQSSLLANAPDTSSSNNGRGRGRGRGRGSSRGRSSDFSNRDSSSTTPIASGPFSMGSTSLLGSGSSNIHSNIQMSSSELGIKLEKREPSEYVDMRSVLGKSDYDPILFKSEKDESDINSNNLRPLNETIMSSDESVLHLLQLPPILPPLDESTLPVMVTTPGSQSELMGPDAWVDPPESSTNNTPVTSDIKSENQSSSDKTVRTRKREGLIGKFIIRASGRVQLKLGEYIFDVSNTPKMSFLQQVVAIDPNMNQAFVLGEIANQLICSPNLDSILASREQAIKDMGQ